MLGSLHDADDALQDTLLRAWRGLAGLEGRSSLRSWLYRIATNACLNLVERRPKRVLPLDHVPAAHLHEAPWPCSSRTRPGRCLRCRPGTEGREAVAGFLTEHCLKVRWRHRLTHANGQVAMGCYAWDDERGCLAAMVVDVLTLRGARIEAVTGFVDAGLVRAVGLPDVLAPSCRGRCCSSQIPS